TRAAWTAPFDGEDGPESTRPLREVEVQRVEEVDGGVRRVHGDVGGDVEQRLRVVEDDLDADVDEVVRSLLCARGGDGKDADDDVLVAHGVGKPVVRRDVDVTDPPADLLGIR